MTADGATTEEVEPVVTTDTTKAPVDDVEAANAILDAEGNPNHRDKD